MTKNWKVIGCSVLAVLCLIVGGLLLSKNSGTKKAAQPPANTSSIGVLDYDKAINAHSLGAAYREKLAAYHSLTVTIERLSEERSKLGAAMPSSLAFSDAARQKRMQAIIKALIELDERLAEIEKKFRQETAPELAKQKKELETAYQTAIVNLRLKIDNSKAMRLPEETVAELKRREQELKRERGAQALELNRQYEEAVAAFVQQASIEERAKLGLKIHETKEYIEAQELFKQGEAVNRNLESIAKNLALDLEQQEKLREARKNIRPVERELRKLEAAVEHDIASAAAKLAVMQKLDTILAKNHNGRNGEICRVLNIDAVDITNDVVTELGRRASIENKKKN